MNPCASVDLHALQHNLQIIRSQSAAKIIAMIKANAYGHGALPVAYALDSNPNVELLAVARLEEALALRKAGIQKDLLLMSGFLNQEELLSILENDFQFVVHSFEQIACLESVFRPLNDETYTAWLKLDLGMHRLGFSEDEAEIAYQRLRSLSFLNLRFMTHFPNTERSNQALIELQTQQFLKLIEEWCGEKSIANSAAIAQLKAHQDWIRPGIMLYGVSPFANETAETLNLKPVMTLRAPILAIRHFKKNDPIGYGGTFVCPEDMPVAIVCIGYGDGYPRHAKSGTPVLIHGKKCPLVGRVSMDMIAVDVRGVAENLKVGDEVVLWGEGLPIELVALSAETIPYELFCRLSSRVEFEYIS